MADTGNVVAIHSSANWERKLNEAKDKLAWYPMYEAYIIVDFTAQWCGPCRIISPVFIELSKKYTDIIFVKIDVDELKDVTAEWDVQAMPTFIFIKDGKAIDRMVGAKRDELERKVAAHAAAAALKK